MTFFQELKRRNVFRVGVAYALAAWVLLQIVDLVLDVISAPEWILQVFALAAAIGLPTVLIFAWAFELTPEGLKRESRVDRSRSITSQTGSKLDRAIIVLLVLTVAALLTDRFMNLERRSDEPAAEQVADEPATGSTSTLSQNVAQRSVAVLPFLAQGGALAIEDAQTPVLVHCASGNRVGALWTTYRLSKGINSEIAFEEGRAAGMRPSLEQKVKEACQTC